jgi:hypothetical protein
MQELPMEALIRRLENGEDREKLILEYGVEAVVDAEEWVRLDRE